MTTEEALQKMQRYCAYQDRCHEEVRSKLINLGVFGDRLERIMAELIADNFLNEERFARSYARGKFRIKRWGRLRIRRELQFRKVSDYCIRKALSEIPEEEYRAVLKETLRKKSARLREPDRFVYDNKLAQYAIRRGFETELVWQVLRELFPRK